MINNPEFSREMRRGEDGAVDALLRLAFDGRAEALLVSKLRRAGVMRMVILRAGRCSQ